VRDGGASPAGDIRRARVRSATITAFSGVAPGGDLL